MKYANSIEKVTGKTFEHILSRIKNSDDIFLVELNGEEIQTEREYLDIISEKFDFPNFGDGYTLGWAGYSDWICDLTWLEYDSIALVIYNFENFLINDNEEKSYIISSFIEDVLPWWETEVVKYVVEGKPKHFTVYLVD